MLGKAVIDICNPEGLIKLFGVFLPVFTAILALFSAILALKTAKMNLALKAQEAGEVLTAKIKKKSFPENVDNFFGKSLL